MRREPPSSESPSRLGEPIYASNCERGAFLHPWGPQQNGVLDLLRWRLSSNPCDEKRAAQVPLVANDGRTLAAGGRWRVPEAKPSAAVIAR